jgi:hypothetical protein
VHQLDDAGVALVGALVERVLATTLVTASMNSSDSASRTNASPPS